MTALLLLIATYISVSTPRVVLGKIAAITPGEDVALDSAKDHYGRY